MAGEAIPLQAFSEKAGNIRLLRYARNDKGVEIASGAIAPSQRRIVSLLSLLAMTKRGPNATKIFAFTEGLTHSYGRDSSIDNKKEFLQ